MFQVPAEMKSKVETLEPRPGADHYSDLSLYPVRVPLSVCTDIKEVWHAARAPLRTHSVYHLFCMSCRHAEPYSALVQGSCWKSNWYESEILLHGHSWESPETDRRNELEEYFLKEVEMGISLYDASQLLETKRGQKESIHTRKLSYSRLTKRNHNNWWDLQVIYGRWV